MLKNPFEASPIEARSLEELQPIELPWEEVDKEQLNPEELDPWAIKQEGVHVFRAKTDVKFKTQTLVLDALKFEDLIGDATYLLRVYKNDAHVYASISLRREPKEIYAHDAVIKRDPHRILAKGLGVELYKIILSLIQRHADMTKLPVRHTVERVVELSSTPMTTNRWDEIFVPILTSSGYVKSRPSGSEWFKLYKPEG
jgi:hypothetical protein